MKKVNVLAMTGMAALSIAAMSPVTSYAIPASFQLPGRGTALVVGSSRDAFCNLEDILNQIGQIAGGENCVQRPEGSRPEGNRPIFPDADRPEGNRPILPDTDQPEEELPGGDADQDSEALSFARQVAELVNEERARNGLSPLTVHTGAEKAAAVRAREIQTSFSHTRPNGSSFSTALTEAGASFAVSGENIAYGQKTPAQVMEAWMNSAGHRANILNPSFRQIGVGYAESASGIGYWTQLFID